MLTINEETKSHLNGWLNYKHVINLDNSEIKILIDSVMHLSNNYIYFNWSMSKLGFGEFSLYLEDDIWFINNECLSVETCAMLLEALEAGVLLEEDKEVQEYARDCLKTIKKDLVLYTHLNNGEIINLDSVSLATLLSQSWSSIEKI